MAEQVEDLKTNNLKSPRIPLWVCVLVVILVTAGAFLIFGGANYIQNAHEIDSHYWHRARDWNDWMRWTVYLLDIGVVAGFLGFVGSTITLTVVNRKESPKAE